MLNIDTLRQEYIKPIVDLLLKGKYSKQTDTSKYFYGITSEIWSHDDNILIRIIDNKCDVFSHTIFRTLNNNYQMTASSFNKLLSKIIDAEFLQKIRK